MSRRIEITVPNEWSPPLRKILEEQCNFNPKSGKPHMLTEVVGTTNTVFLVTVPGPALSPTLEIFRKNGIGSSVGRVILTSVDYVKPDLSAPIIKPNLTVEQMKADVKAAAAAPLQGFQHFQKARKTTEEMYAEISNNANININTWMNLVGASTMAAGGLTTNVLVFIVAAMLVSPIMGPILGMVMGYRVADFGLFRRGFFNEMKMALVTYICGCVFGVVLGNVGNTYKWPNDQMMHEGQAFNLIISIIVSAAAGMVLGVALTATGGNALVGTAISAGLLPPLVNAGMLMSYATVYLKTGPERSLFYSIGMYSVLFYMTHVVTIVIVANIVFWLKDVDPRFREGEDSDLSLFAAHRAQLTEREKAGLFIDNIKADLQHDVQQFTTGMKDLFLRGQMPQFTARDLPAEDDVQNPLHTNSVAARRRASRRMSQGGSSKRKQRKGYDALQDEDEETDDAGVEVQDTRLSPLMIEETTSAGRAKGAREEVRGRIVSFYTRYNPAKLSEVDTLLDKYEGREHELLRKLKRQYSVADDV